MSTLSASYSVNSNPYHMGGSRGETVGPDPPPPPEKSQNIVFLSKTGPNPLKNHKAIKPAFNFRPLSLVDRRWPAYSSIRLDPLPPRQKTLSKLDPSDNTFWIRACISTVHLHDLNRSISVFYRMVNAVL